MSNDVSRIPQDLDSAIQRGTAEMLALPVLVCLSRECRQSRKCLYVCDTEDKAPWCLHLLTKEQRGLYDELCDLVREWALWLRPGSFQHHGADAPGLNPLAKAALEIIAAILPSGYRLWPEARLWRRALYRCKTSKIGTKPEPAQQTTEI
jgi:hypothetical protein